ncbi:unnamed protein product [Owenia fusiformis]|uniref:L-Fucosyltransferase n=1 Tax=Owenia fusiformis TaxID=6347 RepID=A0A8S4N1X5_OWEFU|nr:unnamed protein product [Owenia fusiformis]
MEFAVKRMALVYQYVRTLRNTFLVVLILSLIPLVWIGHIWKSKHLFLQSDNESAILKLNNATTPVSDIKYGNNTVEIKQPMNNDRAHKISNALRVNQNQTTGRGWVSVPRIGRLGNNMFQFAAVMAMSKHYQMFPVYPPEILDGIFNINRSGVLLDKENQNSFPSIQMNEKKASAYDESIMTKDIPGNTNIKLCCYFQSWKYLRGIQEDLRRQFTFKPSIDSIAMRFINQTLINNGDFKSNKHTALVGIHIRRSDMAGSERSYNMGYRSAPKQYFQNAMKYFRIKFKHVHFIICTDDVKWAQDNIRSPDLTFSVGHSAGVDLAILSHCDHIIMSTGTFSWWAAWLSGGEVVYWAGWPKPNTYIGRITEPFDYFLPNWKPML